MQRNSAIDAVRGFAIVLVMIGHCIVLNGLDEGDPYLYDMIKSVQMPLFMLVSGVLAAMGVKRTGSGTGLKKLPARAVSYLVPFFSWFVLVHVFVHLKNHTLSAGMFLKELKELLFQTDRGLWFLMTLFIVTLCAMLAQMLADRLLHKSAEEPWERMQCKKAGIFLAVCAGLYLLFFLQSRSGNTFLSPSLTVQYFPFYLLGYLACGYGESICILLFPSPGTREKLGHAKPAAVLLLFGVFVLLAVVEDLTAPVTGAGVLICQMLASFTGTVSCYAIVYGLAQRRQKKTEKCGFLSFIGLYTLEIYVLHFRFARILGLAEKGLYLYSLQGFFWIMLAFLLMSVLTGVGIMILRRIPVISFLLFGKKSTPQA